MQLFLLFFLFLAPPLTAAQAVCEPFDQVPQPCQSFLVGNWSWVLTAPILGYSQEVLHAQMLQTSLQSTPTTFVSLLDLLPTLKYDCGVAYARALCLAIFNPCDPETHQPVPVCRSVCLNYLQACSGASAVPDICNETNPLTGSPIFLDTEDDCSTNGGDSGFVAEPFVYPCPKPTIYMANEHPDVSNGLPCNARCKERLYLQVRKPEFDQVFVTVSVISWVSMLCCLLVIGIYLYFPELREYPSRLAIFATIGNLMLNIAWVGDSVQNPEEFMCDGNGVELASSGWCQFSGFMLYLGAMTEGSWWCIQGLVLAYNVGFKQYATRLDQRYEWVLHVWGWGYPLVCAFLLSFVPGGHSAGSTGSIPWCVSSNMQLDGLAWGLFWGVLTAYLAIVVVCLTFTLFRIVTMSADSSMPKKTQLNIFLSIFLFGVWFMVTAVSIVALNARSKDQTDAVTAAGTAWYECWFTSRDHWKNCDQGIVFNYGIMWWTGIMISLTGVIIFIIFVPLSSKTRRVFTSRETSLPMSIDSK